MTVTWLDKSLQSILRHVTCYEYETNEQYKHWMLATHIWDLLSGTNGIVCACCTALVSFRPWSWMKTANAWCVPTSLTRIFARIHYQRMVQWILQYLVYIKETLRTLWVYLEPFVVRKIRYIEVRLTEVRNRSLQGKGVRYLEVCMSFGNGPKQHSNCGRPRVWTFKMYMSNASSSRTPWPSFNCHAHSDILSMDTLTFDLDGIRMVKRI